MNRVSQKKKSPGSYKSFQDKAGSQSTKRRCGKCGLPNHQESRRYPASKSLCHKCKKEGHWQRMCKSRNVRCLGQEEDEGEETESSVAYAFLDATNSSASYMEDFTFKAYVSEFSKWLGFVVDTGADITCISDSIVAFRVGIEAKFVRLIKSLQGRMVKSCR